MKRFLNILISGMFLFAATSCTYISDMFAEVPSDYGTTVSCKFNGKLLYRDESKMFDFTALLGTCYIPKYSFAIKFGCPLIYNSYNESGSIDITIASDETFGLNVKYDITSVNNRFDIKSHAGFTKMTDKYKATEGWVMFDSIEVSSDGTSCLASGTFSFDAVNTSDSSDKLKVRDGYFRGVKLNYFDSSVITKADFQ